ncbi:MAG: hypothetical protein IKS17_07770 [Firmicutes bacterium]|nr:hypothetical protein [Bacillota bacterium]
MENTTAEEFLDLYARLENEGRAAYFKKSPDNENIIGRLMNLPQLREYKEDINYCRVVRNFLVHTPRVNSSYAISPSPEMVEFLKKLIENIQNPPRAIDYAVKINNMYTVNLKSNIVDVVRYMQTMGFTHVPVIESGKIFGVFSANVLYTYLSQAKEVGNFDTSLELVRDYLPLHKHTNEYFAFVSRDTTLHEVSKLFKIDVRSMKQLSAVFLTENGHSDEHILAMMTPYSILRDAPDLF